jgi:hypothetical protein
MKSATSWSNVWRSSVAEVLSVRGHAPDPPWFTVSSSVESRTMSS